MVRQKRQSLLRMFDGADIADHQHIVNDLGKLVAHRADGLPGKETPGRFCAEPTLRLATGRCVAVDI